MNSATTGRRHSYLWSVAKTAGFNLAATATSAATGVLLARWLGPTGRGDYAAVTSYFALVLILFELGLGSSVAYHIAKNQRANRDYVWTAVGMLVPLALVASLASVLFGVTVFNGSQERRAAFLLLPPSILLSFLSVPVLFALLSLKIGRWNLARLSQPFAFCLLVIGAHFLSAITVPLVVNLMSASLAVQALLAWWLYMRSSERGGHFQRHQIASLLRYGVVNMSSTAPNTVNGRVDQVVLALVVSSAALGQYAVAVSLSVLGAPLVFAFGYVAFPKLARGEQLADTIKTATRGAALISVASIAVVLILSPFLIPILFGSGYDSVPRLLLVLAPGAAAVVVNQVLGDVLRGLGRPGVVALCEWAGVLSTVGGLLLLVPSLGVMGAALTSTITYLLIHLLLRRTVSRRAAEVRIAATHPSPHNAL